MYGTPKHASSHYGVTKQTLRTWANDGRLKYIKTNGGHRRYLLSPIFIKNTHTAESVIYARVSSQKQKGDLDRQIKFLRSKYPDHRVVSDIGSGINHKRKGFKSILEGVFQGEIKEVVVTQKDRFSRFGFDLFEWIFKQHDAELISDSTSSSDTAELSEDIMAIITVFTARYYGKRRYRILQENSNLPN